MSSSELPPGWTEFKTEDGEPYYHNYVTEETTWDRPSIQTPSTNVPPVPPVLESKQPSVESINLPTRPSLLADIQKGKALKKTAPVESSSSKVNHTENKKAAVVSTIAPVIHPAASAPAQKGGGFAEIMRKNREAAAKKAAAGGDSAAAPAASPVNKSPQTTPVKANVAINHNNNSSISSVPHKAALPVPSSSTVASPSSAAVKANVAVNDNNNNSNSSVSHKAALPVPSPSTVASSSSTSSRQGMPPDPTHRISLKMKQMISELLEIDKREGATNADEKSGSSPEPVRDLDEDRLHRIEKKLDLILAHLKIPFP